MRALVVALTMAASAARFGARRDRNVLAEPITPAWRTVCTSLERPSARSDEAAVGERILMQASKWLLGVGLAALPLACGSGSSETVASRPADDAGYDAGADDASPLPSNDAAAVPPVPLPQTPVTLADCAPSPTAFGSGVFTWLAHCSNLSPAGLIQLEATSVVGAAGYHADETGFDQPVIARVSKSGGAPVILVGERAEAGSGITGLVVDFVSREGRRRSVRAPPSITSAPSTSASMSRATRRESTSGGLARRSSE